MPPYVKALIAVFLTGKTICYFIWSSCLMRRWHRETYFSPPPHVRPPTFPRLVLWFFVSPLIVTANKFGLVPAYQRCMRWLAKSYNISQRKRTP